MSKPSARKLVKKRRDPNALRDSDFWETPGEAFSDEFLACLPTEGHYGEPCAGGCAIPMHLRLYKPRLTCNHASDLYTGHWPSPRMFYPVTLDARKMTERDLYNRVDFFITNPPWRRAHLFPILENLSWLRPTWALLPADFMQRRNSHSLMLRCSDIVPLGPINFNPDGGGKPMQCYSWYMFRSELTDTYVRIRNPR